LTPSVEYRDVNYVLKETRESNMDLERIFRCTWKLTGTPNTWTSMSCPREAAMAVTIENVPVWLIGVHVDPPSSVRTICGYDDPLALLVQPRVSFLKATPTVISIE